MNRIEQHAALKAISINRVSVHGKVIGVGFFISDAVTLLGADRAFRAIRSLTACGKLLTQRVWVGSTEFEFYTTLN